MTSLLLAFIAAMFLLAGFVKGMIGMGLPTVAIGLLGLMMTPAQAAAILIVPSLVTNVWQALAGGQFRAVLAPAVADASRRLLRHVGRRAVDAEREQRRGDHLARRRAGGLRDFRPVQSASEVAAAA